MLIAAALLFLFNISPYHLSFNFNKLLVAWATAGCVDVDSSNL